MPKFPCPKCHKSTLRVSTTNAREDAIWRLRICTNCRLRVETLEMMDEVYEPRTARSQAIRMSPVVYEEYANGILQQLSLEDLLLKQKEDPSNLAYSHEVVRRLKEKNKDNV
jgi:hypothetical protein